LRCDPKQAREALEERSVIDRELKTGWDEFLYWAAKFVSQPNFEEAERAYKVRAVAPFKEAMSRLSDGAWSEPLRRGFQNKDNNVVNWRAGQKFLEWTNTDKASAAAALGILWTDDTTHGSERIEAFDELVPDELLSRPGVFCNLAAYLLGAKDPIRWPNFRVTALSRAYELARYPNVTKRSSSGEHYGRALSFFDTMINEARLRGIPVRDRLDAQGVMWVLAGGGAGRAYDLSAEARGRLDAFVAVPAKLRKQQAQRAKRVPQQRKRPTRGLCPLCGNDDEVRFLGSTGDNWLFECKAGVAHPDPYQFFGS
jgi:hypothetical protein